MPEHRDGTPAAYRELESFLWHDLDGDADRWRAWLEHRGTGVGGATAAPTSCADATMLHAALRTLQAANAGLPATPPGTAIAREALNRLTAHYGIRPRIGDDGVVVLASAADADPAASLLLAALDAMHSGLWRRFKLCRDPACRASYYDVTKAAGQRWCEMMTCGSRNKMRRYRAKG